MRDNNKLLIVLLASLLFIDGVFRILFALVMNNFIPSLYTNTDIVFHLRWFGIGIWEIFFAWGILKYKKWALYGFLALTIIRIYTMVVFPPKGMLVPLHSNLITYSFKLIAAILVIFLFLNRKKIKFT